MCFLSCHHGLSSGPDPSTEQKHFQKRHKGLIPKPQGILRFPGSQLTVRSIRSMCLALRLNWFQLQPVIFETKTTYS